MSDTAKMTETNNFVIFEDPNAYNGVGRVENTAKGTAAMQQMGDSGSGTVMSGKDSNHKVNGQNGVRRVPTSIRAAFLAPSQYESDNMQDVELTPPTTLVMTAPRPPPGFETFAPLPSIAAMSGEELDAELAVYYSNPPTADSESTAPDESLRKDILPLVHFRTHHATPLLRPSSVSSSPLSSLSSLSSMAGFPAAAIRQPRMAGRTSALAHAYREYMHKLPHCTFVNEAFPPSTCIACDGLSAHFRCTRCTLILCRTCVDLIGRLGGSVHRLVAVVARWKLGYSAAACHRDGSVWGAGWDAPIHKRAVVLGEDRPVKPMRLVAGVLPESETEPGSEIDKPDLNQWEEFDESWSDVDSCAATIGNRSDDDDDGEDYDEENPQA